jgi:hypothetical protein
MLLRIVATFEILFFWHVMPCPLGNGYRIVEGTYGDNFVGLLFDLENGGTAWPNIPEDLNLFPHLCKNLK